MANSLLIVKDKKIIQFNGNLREYKTRQKGHKKNIDEDGLLLDFRISSISSRLSMDISKDQREKLEEEYKKLISKRNGN